MYEQIVWFQSSIYCGFVINNAPFIFYLLNLLTIHCNYMQNEFKISPNLFLKLSIASIKMAI